MKKAISALLFAVTTAVTILVACSNETNNEKLPREVITDVESIYELGKCGDENEGDTVYAKKKTPNTTATTKTGSPFPMKNLKNHPAAAR